MNQEDKKPLKNFVPMPRKIKDDYSSGSLTKNEYDILVWILFSTNPINGFYLMSYEGLRQDLRNAISYDNARKIISSLRQKEYIYFLNHKGRKGSFPVYPVDFLLTNGEIQTLNYLKTKLSITTQSQTEEQQKANPENNLRGQNHSFLDQKEKLTERFSVNTQSPKITTPYNDNDTKTNNIIGNKKFSKESGNRFAYSEIIPVSSFNPKSWEEQQCRDIAKAVGEKDMRYLLSRLHKYGFPPIERVWGIYKQDTKKENIKNPPAYFNDRLEKELGLKRNKGTIEEAIRGQ